MKWIDEQAMVMKGLEGEIVEVLVRYGGFIYTM